MSLHTIHRLFAKIQVGLRLAGSHLSRPTLDPPLLIRNISWSSAADGRYHQLSGGMLPQVGREEIGRHSDACVRPGVGRCGGQDVRTPEHADSARGGLLRPVLRSIQQRNRVRLRRWTLAGRGRCERSAHFQVSPKVGSPPHTHTHIRTRWEQIFTFL